MKAYHDVANVPIQTMAKVNKLLHEHEPNYYLEGIGKFITVFTLTGVFPDGKQMDLKVCSGDTNEPLWAEAVLFDENGAELTFSDIDDSINHQWRLEYEGTEYILDVDSSLMSTTWYAHELDNLMCQQNKEV